jgi:hypothetical protein
MWRSERLAAAVSGVEAEIDAAWAGLRALRLGRRVPFRRPRGRPARGAARQRARDPRLVGGRPHTRPIHTARPRAGYELLLPDLIDETLPTTPEAQAFKALINKLTPDQCERVTSVTEVEELATV